MRLFCCARREGDRVMVTMNFEGLLTVAQAARVVDLTPARIRQLCDGEKLSYQWSPLGRLIPREAVEELARQREEKAAAGSR